MRTFWCPSARPLLHELETTRLGGVHAVQDRDIRNRVHAAFTRVRPGARAKAAMSRSILAASRWLGPTWTRATQLMPPVAINTATANAH